MLDQELDRPVALKEIRDRHANEPQPLLAESAERVVQLYEAWGKTELATMWKAKLGLADLPADVFAPVSGR